MLPIVIRLIKNPINEWDNISSNRIENRFILLNYLLPLLIFGCIIKITGRIISVGDYSIFNSALIFITYIAVNLSIIYISTWIINELQPKFKGDKDFNAVFKLLTLSSFPYIIASSIASIHPGLSFIHLISIYALILFWIGTQKLLNIGKEFQTGFILISLLIIATVSIVLNFIITSLFLSIFINF